MKNKTAFSAANAELDAILAKHGVLKNSTWDESKHPREPAGQKGGGRFTSKFPVSSKGYGAPQRIEAHERWTNKRKTNDGGGSSNGIVMNDDETVTIPGVDKIHKEMLASDKKLKRINAELKKVSRRLDESDGEDLDAFVSMKSLIKQQAERRAEIYYEAIDTAWKKNRGSRK